MRLKDKVAVITGAASGIGEATAHLFVEEGAKVIIADIDREGGERVTRDLQEKGGESAFIPVDVSKEEEALRLGPFAMERFGAVHILVNNAGVRVYGPITEASEESWDYILGVNLKGVAFCCKSVIPFMAQSGGGSIVNISSANALVGRGGMGQYDATKAGILALTRSLACDHAHQNIRVNALCPGPTITQYHLRRAAEKGISEEELRRRGAPYVLLKRQAEPREIAYGILFLASDESSYVTGTVLMVDGGYSAI